MLTSRGWWLATVAATLRVLAVLSRTALLTLFALTLLGWLLWSLLAFAVRVLVNAGRVGLLREVAGERGPVQGLWAEHTYHVRVHVATRAPLASPLVRVTDRLPAGRRPAGGSPRAEGTLRPGGEPLEVRYDLHCDTPGRLRFEGVRLEFVDLQGLFCYPLFVRDPAVYPVLPALIDVKGHTPTVKRYNLLPLLGTHRYRRPGSGSELLDLRDYLPGDPPKTIAWKVSARRDKLITKEFESEVPLRCTYFVDASQSVRVGPPGRNALARLVEITAALTQATSLARDLPGLCLFDEGGVAALVRPARGPRHRVEMLHRLAEAADRPPAAADVDPDALLPLAYSFAREVYPELLARDVNGFPWWLPLWAPQWEHARFTRSWWGNALAALGRWQFWAFAYLGSNCVLVAAFLLADTRSGWPALIGLGLLNLGWLSWFLYGRLRRGQNHRWRKQVAALLSVRHGLAPGGLALLMEDPRAFALHAQRFLAEHGVSYPVPLYDDRGRYLFAAPGKVDVLAAALMHAIARGKDNELFVLLADLLELDDRLEPLFRAVKVALARHHHVLVLCPWPPDLKPPGRDDAAAALPVGDLVGLLEGEPLPDLLEHVTGHRLRRAFHALRRSFGRFGVPVLCAAEDDSVKLVLERLERMRLQAGGVR